MSACVLETLLALGPSVGPDDLEMVTNLRQEFIEPFINMESLKGKVGNPGPAREDRDAAYLRFIVSKVK